MDLSSYEDTLESARRFRKWEKGAKYVFGLDIPGEKDHSYTDLVPEDTVQDYKCRREVDLDRSDLKRMKLFPALSKARENFLKSSINTEGDAFKSLERIKLPPVHF